MIKYFLQALKLVNKIMNVKEGSFTCQRCEFYNECEIQDDKLCGYDKTDGDK